MGFCKAFMFFVATMDFYTANAQSWYDIKGAECHLDKQSPIELNRFDALPTYRMPLVHFHNFSVSFENATEVWNSGYTVNIKLPRRKFTFIAKGPLFNAQYLTDAIHFHWGSSNFHGSEHVINGKRASMEMHIVNRNRKYFNNKVAKKNSDGFANLSILFRVDSNLKKGYAGLNKIVKILRQVHYPYTFALMDNFLLSDLLADVDTSVYYTYRGSLSTPPCSRVVTWIVFPKPIYISPAQIREFRLLRNKKEKRMVNNYRPLQPSFMRTVYLRRNNETKINEEELEGEEIEE